MSRFFERDLEPTSYNTQSSLLLELTLAKYFSVSEWVLKLTLLCLELSKIRSNDRKPGRIFSAISDLKKC